MGQKLLGLVRAHVARMVLAKKPDKSSNPIQIGLLGPTMPMTKHHRPRIHAATPKRQVSAWSVGLMVMFTSACSSDGVEITAYPMLCEAPSQVAPAAEGQRP